MDIENPKAKEKKIRDMSFFKLTFNRCCNNHPGKKTAAMVIYKYLSIPQTLIWPMIPATIFASMNIRRMIKPLSKR